MAVMAQLISYVKRKLEDLTTASAEGEKGQKELATELLRVVVEYSAASPFGDFYDCSFFHRQLSSELISLLLQHGADPSIKVKEPERTIVEIGLPGDIKKMHQSYWGKSWNNSGLSRARS